jgi:hypothetical protein
MERRHILIDRILHSSVPDVPSFRAVGCNTRHCMVVAEVKDRLTKNAQILYGEVQSQEIKRGRRQNEVV